MTSWALCTSDLKYMSITKMFSFVFICLFVFSIALVSVRSGPLQVCRKREIFWKHIEGMGAFPLGLQFLGSPCSFWRQYSEHVPKMKCTINQLFPYKTSTISPTSHGFINKIGNNLIDTLRYINCIVLAIINLNTMAYLELKLYLKK